MKTYRGKILEREIRVKALVGRESRAPVVRADALIDTGTTTSGITPSLVAKLGLTDPKRRVSVQGVYGRAANVDVHNVSIYLTISRAQPAGTVFLAGRDSIEVIVIDDSDIDVLIGMDFLDGFHLAMFRDSFTLSHPPPSAPDDLLPSTVALSPI